MMTSRMVEDEDVVSEQSQPETSALLRSRSSYKGKYTLARNELEHAIVFSSNSTIVHGKLDIALKAFQRFKDAHNVYLSRLEPGSNYDRECEFLDPFEDETDQLRLRVTKWLHDCRKSGAPVSSKTHRSSLASSQSSKKSREIRLQQLKRKQAQEREIEELRRIIKEREEQRELQDQLDKEELDEMRSLRSVKFHDHPNTLKGDVTHPKFPLIVSAAASLAPVGVETGLSRPPTNQSNLTPSLNPQAQKFEVRTNDNQWRPQVPVNNNSGVTRQVRLDHDLPSIQVPKFSGDPGECSFDIVQSSMSQSKDGHVILPLPFKPNLDELIANRYLAESNLESICQSNPHLHEKYTNTIERYISMRHVAKVVGKPETKSFYLPPHTVVHPRKFKVYSKWEDTHLNGVLHLLLLLLNIVGVIFGSTVRGINYKYSKLTKQTTLKNFYVYDCLVCVRSVLDVVPNAYRFPVIPSIHNNTKSINVFFANRLQKFWNVSEPDHRKHISGEVNPADIACSVHAQKFLSSRWVLGPKLLWQPNETCSSSVFSPVTEVDLKVQLKEV